MSDQPIGLWCGAEPGKDALRWPMRLYKLLFLNDSGRVSERLDFLAPTDDHAQQTARDMDDGRARELWCGLRWIETLTTVRREPVRH